jgi:hypothetical protein
VASRALKLPLPERLHGTKHILEPSHCVAVHDTISLKLPAIQNSKQSLVCLVSELLVTAAYFGPTESFHSNDLNYQELKIGSMF